MKIDTNPPRAKIINLALIEKKTEAFINSKKKPPTNKGAPIRKTGNLI